MQEYQQRGVDEEGERELLTPYCVCGYKQTPLEAPWWAVLPCLVHQTDIDYTQPVHHYLKITPVE